MSFEEVVFLYQNSSKGDSRKKELLKKQLKLRGSFIIILADEARKEHKLPSMLSGSTFSQEGWGCIQRKIFPNQQGDLLTGPVPISLK